MRTKVFKVTIVFGGFVLSGSLSIYLFDLFLKFLQVSDLMRKMYGRAFFVIAMFLLAELFFPKLDPGASMRRSFSEADWIDKAIGVVLIMLITLGHALEIVFKNMYWYVMGGGVLMVLVSQFVRKIVGRRVKQS